MTGPAGSEAATSTLQGAAADRIFRGAVVWPGAPGPLASSAPPFKGSVAVADGRILALGPDAEIEALRTRETEVVDVRGCFLCPGFQDAHVHLLTGGFKLEGVDLRHAGSRDGFVAPVRRRVEELPPGRWIVGGEWDQERWGGPLPHRDWIDFFSAHHPVILNRLDMHIALANGRALELAGIDDRTPDPPNGRIDREPGTGRPTGILREAAILRVWEAIPSPGKEEWRRALERASEHALRRGVTQVHDMGMMERPAWTWDALETLREARREGRLRLRVRASLPAADWERARDLVQEEGPGDDLLRWDAVKAFVDGSLGARTAWFHEPYLDDPGSGGPVIDLESLRHQIRSAALAGLRPIVHAIGERANDWLLGVYGELARDLRDGGVRSPDGRQVPLRVEHAQHLTVSGLALASQEPVVLSMQPAHLVEDGPWLERALGPERARRSYALRSLLERKARLAFGSDWTVTALDPLRGVAAAVGRRVRSGERCLDAWLPEEGIETWEALRAYTAGAAHAVGETDRFGSLAPGKVADLTVLSGSPFDVEPSRIEELAVEMTVVAGEVRHPVAEGGR